jgi:hypothetical protein
MKPILIALFSVIFYTNSYAQDVSRSESVDQAYRQLPDGSTMYVGKCKTHEDWKGKSFKVSGVVLDRVSTEGMRFEAAKKIHDQIGAPAFRMMMKEYFGNLADLSSNQKTIKEFIDYADDLEIDVIQLIHQPSIEFIRFNVGFGGGNGGFLVLQKTASGWKKISSTEDGDLNYCDATVWN